MPLKLVRFPGRSPYWYVRGTVKGARILQSAQTTERARAEVFRQKLEAEAWEGRLLGRRPPAGFAEAVEAYLAHGHPRRFLKRLVKHFADTPLPGIGQAEVDRAAMALYPMAKAATRVRQVYGPVIAVLRHARAAKLEGASVPQIKLPKVSQVPPKWATDDHLEKLLPECSPHLAALVLVLTVTGLRVSEALRLRPPDFLKRPGWVNVERTKTGDPAFVPLPEQVQAAVARVMPKDLEPVFRYLSEQGVNRALKKAAKRAGLPHLPTHAVGRHAFAARLLDEGHDIKMVKEAGRWKSLRTVDKIYGHLEQRAVHEAMLEAGKRVKIG